MRKSKEKRIEEATALMEGYESESLSADYRYRFISDMKARLLRGKSMSTKQRSWFDSLVEEGVPVIDTDKEKISAIKSALALKGMGHRQEPLQSFLSTLARGRTLSERQESFLSSMLKEADGIRENGPYVPDPKIVERLRDCVRLSKSYTAMYWSTHPGTYKSLQTVQLWLEDQDRHIDSWSVEKLLKAMRSKLDELHEKPYVAPGDFIWCHRFGEGLVPGVVVEAASISEKGEIVYGVLSGSQVVSVSKGSLSKRGRRS
jgi:hypothetical protein